MKKAILGLVLVFMAGIVFGQTIVVSTFSTRGQAVTADDAESITELFIAELAKQSGVRVVDRTSLDRVLTEMRFQTSDWSNSQKTAQLGAALNAEFLVRGQINQLGPQISFALTALDIRTLEVVSSSTRTFSADTIFTTNVGALFGPVTSWNSSSVLSVMSADIANPIKTKMTELAEQRQEQERLRQLVGTWKAIGSSENFSEVNISNGENSMEITFYSDGTLYITLRQCWQAGSGSRFSDYPDPVRITRMSSSGSGHYTLNGNELRVSWDQSRSGITYTQKTITTGSGRNATTSTIWEPSNINKREPLSFDGTIEISQNGRNMTWKQKLWGIPSLFVKQ